MKFFKNRKLVLAFCVFLFLCFFVLSANFCLAQSLLEDSSQVKYEGSLEKGDFTLNDFVRALLRVSEIIFGVVGSLALLMFVYGGLMFIISSGSSEKVTKAKEIIVGAVIGLVIVFTSYMIIGFVFSAFDVPGSESWASSNWFKK